MITEKQKEAVKSDVLTSFWRRTFSKDNLNKESHADRYQHP